MTVMDEQCHQDNVTSTTSNEKVKQDSPDVLEKAVKDIFDEGDGVDKECLRPVAGVQSPTGISDMEGGIAILHSQMQTSAQPVPYQHQQLPYGICHEWFEQDLGESDEWWEYLVGAGKYSRKKSTQP